MQLDAFTCGCGSDDIIAVRPGSDPKMAGIFDFHLTRGEPVKCWCKRCWLAAQGKVEVPA